jgi:hypothetical protein
VCKRTRHAQRTKYARGTFHSSSSVSASHATRGAPILTGTTMAGHPLRSRYFITLSPGRADVVHSERCGFNPTHRMTMRRGWGGGGNAVSACCGSEGDDGREWRRLLSEGMDRAWRGLGAATGSGDSGAGSPQSLITSADSAKRVCPTL